MSRRSLLLAVRDLIAEKLSYKRPLQCETMKDGAPPPICGDVFVAVHRMGRQSRDRNSLDLTTGAYVTVTMKVTQPYDRIGTDLIEKAKQGMDDRTDALIDLLHMNYAILHRANQYLLEAAVSQEKNIYGWAEPLGFEGDDGDPHEVGADWFKADPGKLLCGVVQELRFGGARRLRSIESLRPGEL